MSSKKLTKGGCILRHSVHVRGSAECDADTAFPSVCLSVCLCVTRWYYCVNTTKRPIHQAINVARQVSARSVCCVITGTAVGVSSFQPQRSWWNLIGSLPTGTPNTGVVEKLAIFNLHLAASQKRYNMGTVKKC